MSLLQWKHTTAAVQKTLAPTGTHWNALLTISPLSISFTHLHWTLAYCSKTNNKSSYIYKIVLGVSFFTVQLSFEYMIL